MHRARTSGSRSRMTARNSLCTGDWVLRSLKTRFSPTANSGIHLRVIACASSVAPKPSDLAIRSCRRSNFSVARSVPREGIHPETTPVSARALQEPCRLQPQDSVSFALSTIRKSPDFFDRVCARFRAPTSGGSGPAFYGNYPALLGGYSGRCQLNGREIACARGPSLPTGRGNVAASGSRRRRPFRCAPSINQPIPARKHDHYCHRLVRGVR